jgi:hypothetical protein
LHHSHTSFRHHSQGEDQSGSGRSGEEEGRHSEDEPPYTNLVVVLGGAQSAVEGAVWEAKAQEVGWGVCAVAVDRRGRTLHASQALGRVLAAVDRGDVAGERVEDPKMTVVCVDAKLTGLPPRAEQCHVGRVDNQNSVLRCFGMEPTIIDPDLTSFIAVGVDRMFALDPGTYMPSRRQRQKAALTEWTLADDLNWAERGRGPPGVYVRRYPRGSDRAEPQRDAAAWIAESTQRRGAPRTLLVLLDKEFGKPIWR